MGRPMGWTRVDKRGRKKETQVVSGGEEINGQIPFLNGA